MNLFTCPVCGELLNKTQKSYLCSHNHTFDIAKSGYVNLLISKGSGKEIHGDNKLMVQSRRNFLDKGFYNPLKEALCAAVCKYTNEGSVVFDAGCGEGYYTSAVNDALKSANRSSYIFGADISKTAVEFAAKRSKDISYAAASVFHLPVNNSACDTLITFFAPYCGHEYQRILHDSGYMIMAIPSVEHLWELKQAIYDTPYQNEVKPYELDGFTLIEKERIHYKIEINTQDDIQSLFSMTPYYYKTGRVEQERLNNLKYLKTQIDFELLVYKRERNENNGT